MVAVPLRFFTREIPSLAEVGSRMAAADPGSLEAIATAVRSLEDEVRAYLQAKGRGEPPRVEAAELRLREGRLGAAAALATQGLRRRPPAEEQARLQLVLAAVDRLEGRAAIACERLRTEAAFVADASPLTAVRLLCEASRAAFSAADPASALATAEQATLLVSGGPADLRAEAGTTLALARLLAGSADAEALLESILDRTRASPPTLLGAIHGSSAALLWTERYDEARRVLDLVIGRARSHRLMGVLPVALDTLGAVEFRIGRWAAAEARSTEALRLGRTHAGAFETASFHTTLARLYAARGRRAACDLHLRAAARLCRENSLIAGFHATAAALLELSLGRPEQAVTELERVESSDAARFEPNVLRWEADLVEALIRAGRADAAAVALERFGERAHSTRRAWTQAALHRCRGLLASPDGFDEEFSGALRWHARSPMPFERARTELCYAERLRRVRRSTEAQAHFRSALGTFEQLGAEPWVVRARRGLATRGSRGRAPVEMPLTPHESQVAALVQRGATNKEAAAALFVTPKTIEYHLANVYRKLGVRSRAELVWLLARRTAPVGEPERADRRQG
jgi:DNA-binding CsgD family transcriptional regulator